MVRVFEELRTFARPRIESLSGQFLGVHRSYESTAAGGFGQRAVGSVSSILYGGCSVVRA